MNALIVKRKLHQLRAGILTHLKATVERSGNVPPILETPPAGSG